MRSTSGGHPYSLSATIVKSSIDGSSNVMSRGGTPLTARLYTTLPCAFDHSRYPLSRGRVFLTLPRPLADHRNVASALPAILALPEQKRGNSRRDQHCSEHRVARVGPDRADDDVRGNEDEQRRQHRITRHTIYGRSHTCLRVAASICEDGCHDESKEYPVAEHHIVEQLPVRSGERQRHCPDRLNRDAAGGTVILRMQSRCKSEEESVGRHRLQHPRCRQNATVDEPDRRDDDARGHERAANRPHHDPHCVCGRRQTRSQSPGTKRPQVGDVRQNVDGDHDRYPASERPWQSPLRIHYLARDVVGVLPAAVREENRNERDSESAHHTKSL